MNTITLIETTETKKSEVRDSMGRIRAKRTGGMGLIAKISLMLAITMVFSLSAMICLGPQEAAAADTMIHNSDSVGTCSNTTYTNKADCTTNGGTWTTRWPGDGGWGIPAGKYGEFVCETCHVKDATNIKRIRSSITTPNTTKGTLPGHNQPIIFDRTKGTVGDPGTMGDDSNTPRASSDKICEVCHTYDAAKVNGVNVHANAAGVSLGNHQNANAKDCIACHKHNEGFRPADCRACHGYPPTVNTAGVPDGLALFDGKTTGSLTAGRHDKHANVLGYSCDNCHNNTAMFVLSTVPGLEDQWDISIGFNNFGIETGTYGGQLNVSYNQTAGDGTLTCSTVYCHSNVQGTTDGTGTPSTYGSPVWDSAGSVQCGSCHKSDGTGTGILMDSGKHTKHVSATYSKACSECHTGGGSGSADHVNGNINMGFVADPFATSGSYSQAPNNVPGDGYGSCSNVYCHSIAQTNGGGALVAGTGNYKNPSWAGSVVCGNCHSIPPASGKHAIHADTASYGFDCWACHNNAGINKGTGVPTPLHTNKNVDMSFDPTYGASASYSQSPNPPGNGYGTCSNVYCHSNGKSLDAGSGVTQYATPGWSDTLTCKSCHGVEAGSLAGEPAYTNGGSGNVDANTHGSHVTAVTDCNKCHDLTADATGAIKVSGGKHVNKTQDVNLSAAIGGSYAAGTCSSTMCHGGTSPAWGGNTTNDTCTKCHGTGTATVDASNRYVVAPPKNTAGGSGTPTGTGQVSDDPKVGAHQTHLRLLNGLRSTAIETIDNRCEYCHGTLPGSGTHANGSSTPAFQGLATKDGAMSPTYVGTTCNNTYCHNPAAATGGTLLSGNSGSAVVPGWTDATYLGDTLKTQVNCGKCHKVPGDAGFEPAGTHTGMTIAATDCAGCHGHNGDTLGVAGQRHLDGIKYGGGNCNSCHDYDVNGATYAGGVWTGGTWGKSVTGSNPEGFGAHAKHINHIKTRLSIATALDPVGQTFGINTPANVCGICHTNTGTNHLMGGSTARSINFGDGSTVYQFGPSAPLYNGNSTTSSSVNPKSCSNISCHFTTTPVWSAY